VGAVRRPLLAAAARPPPRLDAGDAARTGGRHRGDRAAAPGVSLAPITVCALAIVFFSATQDIAIDAYRADVSLPSERGLAAAAANLGYRSASWIAVAVALVIADHFGWRLAFLILAAAMALFAVATVRAPASHNTYQPRSLRESVVAPLRELLGTRAP